MEALRLNDHEIAVTLNEKEWRAIKNFVLHVTGGKPPRDFQSSIGYSKEKAECVLAELLAERGRIMKSELIDGDLMHCDVTRRTRHYRELH
jgi:hypothetical protein